MLLTCQFSIAQTEDTVVTHFPFYSNLAKVDKTDTLEFEKVISLFPIMEFAETIDSMSNWELIELKISSSAYGGISEDMRKPVINI